MSDIVGRPGAMAAREYKVPRLKKQPSIGDDCDVAAGRKCSQALGDPTAAVFYVETFTPREFEHMRAALAAKGE